MAIGLPDLEHAVRDQGAVAVMDLALDADALTPLCPRSTISKRYNFRRLIRWLSLLLRRFLTALFSGPLTKPA